MVLFLKYNEILHQMIIESVLQVDQRYRSIANSVNLYVRMSGLYIAEVRMQLFPNCTNVKQKVQYGVLLYIQSTSASPWTETYSFSSGNQKYTNSHRALDYFESWIYIHYDEFQPMDAAMLFTGYNLAVVNSDNSFYGISGKS